VGKVGVAHRPTKTRILARNAQKLVSLPVKLGEHSSIQLLDQWERPLTAAATNRQFLLLLHAFLLYPLEIYNLYCPDPFGY
jgi:hypothetical protein